MRKPDRGAGERLDSYSWGALRGGGCPRRLLPAAARGHDVEPAPHRRPRGQRPRRPRAPLQVIEHRNCGGSSPSRRHQPTRSARRYRAHAARHRAALQRRQGARRRAHANPSGPSSSATRGCSCGRSSCSGSRSTAAAAGSRSGARRRDGARTPAVDAATEADREREHARGVRVGRGAVSRVVRGWSPSVPSRRDDAARQDLRYGPGRVRRGATERHRT